MWIWVLWGCGPVPATPEVLDTDTPTPVDTAPPTPEVIEAVWQTGIRPLLELRCSPCHFGYDFGHLSLQQRVDFVDVPSSAGPLIVASGDLEASYLWHKVNDTHDEIGGAGERMPLDLAPLPVDELAVLAEWIELGTP